MNKQSGRATRRNIIAIIIYSRDWSPFSAPLSRPTDKNNGSTTPKTDAAAISPVRPKSPGVLNARRRTLKMKRGKNTAITAGFFYDHEPEQLLKMCRNQRRGGENRVLPLVGRVTCCAAIAQRSVSSTDFLLLKTFFSPADRVNGGRQHNKREKER